MSSIFRSIHIKLRYCGVPDHICEPCDSIYCLALSDDILEPQFRISNINGVTSINSYKYARNILSLLRIKGIVGIIDNDKYKDISCIENGYRYDRIVNKYIKMNREELLNIYYISILEFVRFIQKYIFEDIIVQYGDKNINNYRPLSQDQYDILKKDENELLIVPQIRLIHKN